MKKMVIFLLLLMLFAFMAIQTVEAGYVSKWVNMAISYDGEGSPVWVDLPIWINHGVMCI